MCNCLQNMPQGPEEPSSFRNRSTARLITNVAHGLNVDEENRFLLKAWRGSMRTIWSDSNPSPRSGLGFGKNRDDAASDAVQAMRDASAADTHGNKATSAKLESAKKLQAHADKSLGFLMQAQPLGDVIPDVFSRANTPSQSSALPKAPMLKFSHFFNAESVREIEEAMSNNIRDDQSTHASVHNNTRDQRRTTTEHDLPTTSELYGSFRVITEEEYADENRRWVLSGSAGLPPLNIQQRNAGRPNIDYFIKLKKWMSEAHTQRDAGLRPATVQPVAPLTFIHAEPGAGKSVLVEVLCEWLRDFSKDSMKVICCSFTGSAASLVPQGRTINNLFGFTVEEAGGNINVHDQSKRHTPKKTVTLAELTAMFDLMSERPWHAVCVVNDEVSQTTAALLGHIEQRMTRVSNSSTKDAPFGGHAVTLVGDFFQKTPPGNASIFTSMVDRYVRHADGVTGTSSQRKQWGKCYDIPTPMARGVAMFKTFKLVTLGAQMRSQSDPLHIEMIRSFRDITSDVPCPLSPFYLESILPYSKNDGVSDISWTTAPIAVAGNVERIALSANRVKVLAKRNQQPVLKWKQEIKDCSENEFITSMEQSALDELYDNEEALWQYFVAGAIAVLTENICVTRGLANGTRVVYLRIGYYDRDKHERVLQDIERAIEREETEVILPGPPDYMVVELTHKSTQRSRLSDITPLLRNGPHDHIADGTDRICLAYRRSTTPKTSSKDVTLGSRFAYRRGLVKVSYYLRNST